jgi:hypothetical protein
LSNRFLRQCIGHLCDVSSNQIFATFRQTKSLLRVVQIAALLQFEQNFFSKLFKAGLDIFLLVLLYSVGLPDCKFAYKNTNFSNIWEGPGSLKNLVIIQGHSVHFVVFSKWYMWSFHRFCRSVYFSPLWFIISIIIWQPWYSGQCLSVFKRTSLPIKS